MPHMPVGTTAKASYNAGFEYWWAEFKKSWMALQHRLDNMARKPEKYELALVCRKDAGSAVIHFINWTDESKRLGRPAALEVRPVPGRIIFTMPSCKILNLHDAEVVHPATGGIMEKVKQGERPHMPAGPIRLKNMCEAALMKDSKEAIVLGGCSICEKSDVVGDNLSQCPVCLCSMHPSCASLLLDWSVRNKPSLPEDCQEVTVRSVPRCFRGSQHSWCVVCLAHLTIG